MPTGASLGAAAAAWTGADPLGVALACAGPHWALGVWPAWSASRRRVGGLAGFVGLASEICLFAVPVVFAGVAVVDASVLPDGTDAGEWLLFDAIVLAGIVAALPAAVAASLGSAHTLETPLVTASRAAIVALLGFFFLVPLDAGVLEPGPLPRLVIVDGVVAAVFLAALTVSRRTDPEPPTPA